MHSIHLSSGQKLARSHAIKKCHRPTNYINIINYFEVHRLEIKNAELGKTKVNMVLNCKFILTEITEVCR